MGYAQKADDAADEGRPTVLGEDPLQEGDASQEQSFPSGFKPSAGIFRPFQNQSPSETGSSRSAAELPPRFEAEMSGSECSMTALELHEQQFGVLSKEDTPRDFVGWMETSTSATNEERSPASTTDPKHAMQEVTFEVKQNLIHDAPRLSSDEDVKGPTIDVGVDHPAAGKGLCCVFC